MRARVATAAVLVVLAGLVLAPWPEPQEAPGATTVLRVAPASLLDSLRRLEAEVGGLRSRISGVRSVPPMATRIDTVLLPVPDTVSLGTRIDFVRREALSVWGVVDTVGTMRPGASAYAVPKNCDDALLLMPGGIVCDADVLGTLAVYGGVGAVYELDKAPAVVVGVEWEPYVRSPNRLSLEVETSALGVRASLMWRRRFFSIF